MGVYSWFLVCFSRLSVFDFGGVGGCGVKTGDSQANMRVVGEFLVFGEALLALRVRDS